tara:strand:+ start:139 stop:936 length:798 start_codon:yes stop_codon:yes gene_type:complete
MGFKKFFGKVVDKIEDVAENAKESYDERQEQKMDDADFEDLLDEKREELLNKFEMSELKKICEDVLGEVPESEWGEDDGKEYEVKPKRKNYLEFIDDALEDEDLNFEQIKDFSLKHKIVSKKFFDFELEESADTGKFEEIIKTIQNEFPSENIHDEKELQAQLTVFLKTKYPNSEVERESRTDGGIIDILMDGEYAFELKVPSTKTELRNLRGQIEEYQEEFSNLCVIIFDNQADDISENIKKYVNIYHEKYDVPSIVLHGKKRK